MHEVEMGRMEEEIRGNPPQQQGVPQNAPIRPNRKRPSCLNIVWIERIIAFIGIILGTGGSCFGTITLIDGINNFFVDVTADEGKTLLYTKLYKVGSGAATLATSLYLYEEAYCRLYRGLTVSFTYLITAIIVAYAILSGGSDKVAAVIVGVIMEGLIWIMLAYMDVVKEKKGSDFFKAAKGLPNKEKRRLKRIIQLVSAPSCFVGVAVGLVLLGDEFNNMNKDKHDTSTYSGHLDNLESLAGMILTCAVVLTVISEIKQILAIAIFIGLLVLRIGLFVFGIIEPNIPMLIGAGILLGASLLTFPLYFIHKGRKFKKKAKKRLGCISKIISGWTGFVGVILGIGGTCFGVITFIDGINQLYASDVPSDYASTEINYRFIKIGSGSATLATSMYLFEEAYWRIPRFITGIVVYAISILICVYGIYASSIDQGTSIGILTVIIFVTVITMRFLEKEEKAKRCSCSTLSAFCWATPKTEGIDEKEEEENENEEEQENEDEEEEEEEVEDGENKEGYRALKFLIQLFSAPTCFIGIIAGFLLLCDEFNNMRLDQGEQTTYGTHLDNLETCAGIILTCAVVLTVMDDIKHAVGAIILISMFIFSVGLFIAGGINSNTPMLVSAGVLGAGFIIGAIIQCFKK